MDLDPIEARANAVTEGRWAIWEDLNHQGYITVGDESGVLDERQSTEECNPVAHVYTQHDAEFIAAARTDVPALVARVRELEEENQKLRDEARLKNRAAYLNGINLCMTRLRGQTEVSAVLPALHESRDRAVELYNAALARARQLSEGGK